MTGRVAVVYHFFPHYRQAIIRELQESDRFEYVFVGGAQDPDASGIREYHFDNRAHHKPVPTAKVFHRFLIQGGLVRLALRRDLDCIIYFADAQFLTTWISAPIARLSGKRVLYWTQGWTSRDRGVKRLIRKTFYHQANGLLLYGDRAQAIATSEGFDPGQVYVIYNSLDYTLQRSLRQSSDPEEISGVHGLFQDPASPIALFSGRLVKSARVDMVIDALALMQWPVNLLVIGDGPELIRLKQAAEERGVEAVFVGSEYDEKRLAAYFMAANVTVSPGKVGLLAMHSLAYGTPVITHDEPDLQMPESEAITPGVTGSEFVHGSVESLANAIGAWTRLRRHPGDINTACLEVIESRYNARNQREIIEQAVMGIPADGTPHNLVRPVETPTSELTAPPQGDTS